MDHLLLEMFDRTSPVVCSKRFSCLQAVSFRRVLGRCRRPKPQTLCVRPQPAFGPNTQKKGRWSGLEKRTGSLLGTCQNRNPVIRQNWIKCHSGFPFEPILKERHAKWCALFVVAQGGTKGKSTALRVLLACSRYTPSCWEDFRDLTFYIDWTHKIDGCPWSRGIKPIQPIGTPSIPIHQTSKRKPLMLTPDAL